MNIFIKTFSIRNIPQEDINKIKTKMRITCKKYSEISVPYKYRIIARDLSNNRGIISLQQDKGRGVVRINSENAWINVLILNTEQLIKVLNGPASYIEKKI